MLRTLLALMRPLHSIARELRIIRELYELWLWQQDPPIYRVTEKPHQSDTEVTYSGLDTAPKKKFKNWFKE